ncbi:MAG TPA: exo-alpha-sialidase [Candidatus Limnocylindria bacterium]|nr:exo-alpha-sialidase [Candidatus Limnocylindria bacterium]
MAKSVVLLVGTKKGLYTMRSGDRKKWTVGEPYGAPAPVHHAAFDPRDGSMYAAINSTWGGSRIEYSRDLGKTWTVSKNPAFPPGSDRTFYQTWHIEPGHAKTPNVVWAGVEPAALFKSEDRGETWSLNTALDGHPSRKQWVPGFGGMGLHSIAIDAADPSFMQVGISVGGVYTTRDGGASWERDNTRRGGAQDRPDVFSCIHKLLAHPVAPGVRFMRVHEEVYWRDPGETAWTFRTTGLPSNFGFAAAIHPRDPKTAWCIPLHGMKRTATDGIAVYKTTDRGASWTRNDAGLPKGAPLESLREGMHTDRFDDVGVYFGTANGDVYASLDEGKTWDRIAQYLPYVTSVHAATID